ncbi:hypothetical protein WR25_22159 [Diploscapter pachys]|uniref:Uncharacterized protein n=1 Tax=Diploscapter pachys TaxID=2018661 RepID=A0A2A2JYS0_9BILA|nr:hypothetical protein WR25_22159 [Diploscapter pachys]
MACIELRHEQDERQPRTGQRDGERTESDQPDGRMPFVSRRRPSLGWAINVLKGNARHRRAPQNRTLRAIAGDEAVAAVARHRVIGGPVGPVAVEVALGAAADGMRYVGADRRRPFGYARQPLSGEVAHRGAAGIGGGGVQRFDRGRAVGVVAIRRVGISDRAGEAQPIRGANRQIALQPARADLRDVGDVVDVGVGADDLLDDRRLIVVDAGLIGGEVQRHAPVEKLRLQTDLDIVHRLGSNDGVDARGQVGQVQSLRLRPARIGGVEQHILRRLPAQRRQPRDAVVVGVDGEGLDRGQGVADRGDTRDLRRRQAGGRLREETLVRIAAPLLLMRVAQPGGQAERGRDVPRALTEDRAALGMRIGPTGGEQAVAGEARHGLVVRRKKRERGVGAEFGTAVPTHHLLEIIGTQQPVDGVRAGGGEAQFLAELALEIEDMVLRVDRQRGQVAIVARKPVPLPDRGDRRERRPTQIVIDLTRHAPGIHVGLERRIGIRPTRKRIDRQRRIIGEVRDPLEVGVRDRGAVVIAREGADRQVDAARLLLLTPVADDTDRQVGRGGQQQLAAHRGILIIMDAATRLRVVEEAVAAAAP